MLEMMMMMMTMVALMEIARNYVTPVLVGVAGWCIPCFRSIFFSLVLNFGCQRKVIDLLQLSLVS